MELSQQIVKTANILFRSYGIKNVTMDFVSKQIGISKRTLYAYYPSKVQLVYDSICSDIEELEIQIAETQKSSSSPVRILIWYYSTLYEKSISYCPAFMEDLKRFPSIVERFEKLSADIDTNSSMLFTKGVKEGYFRPDKNFDSISFLINEFIRNNILISRHQPLEKFIAATAYFLKEFSTPKGITELAPFLLTKNKN